MRASILATHLALSATAGSRTVDPRLLPARQAGWQPLPPPGRSRIATDLWSVLAQRRSRYTFGGQPSLDQLATLLDRGVGTAPRAGGLPSVQPYLVSHGPGPLRPGVHRVETRLPIRGLATIRCGDPTRYLAASLDQPPFADRVPLWVALTADLHVGAHRYPARHYRTLHLDAGAALQNLLLTATALGLSTCPVMGFDDAAWSRLLHLRDHEAVMVLVAVGQAQAAS